jgi:hypothetical protein
MPRIARFSGERRKTQELIVQAAYHPPFRKARGRMGHPRLGNANETSRFSGPRACQLVNCDQKGNSEATL